jgi:hypothetical protein
VSIRLFKFHLKVPILLFAGAEFALFRLVILLAVTFQRPLYQLDRVKNHTPTFDLAILMQTANLALLDKGAR